MKSVIVRHVLPNDNMESHKFESVKDAEDFVRTAKKQWGWGTVFIDRETLTQHLGEIRQAVELQKENLVTEMNRIFKGSRNMYFAQWDRMEKSYGTEHTIAHFTTQLKPFIGK
jgi:hypothetical protein